MQNNLCFIQPFFNIFNFIFIFFFLIRKFVFIIFIFLSFFILALENTQAQELWKGIMFSPVTNRSNSHELFIKDFKVLVFILKTKGINTIVFDMNNKAFHFTSDKRLDTLPYPANRGFSASETRQMTKIARDNGMRVIVAMQVLSHWAGHSFAAAYPEYMLPVSEWQAGKLYENKLDYIKAGQKAYKAIKTHTSDVKNAPPAAKYWEESISSPTRDPFSADGEKLVFKMIDELIEAFTVDAIAPDGFHLASDELRYWYEEPELQTGYSSAQIFAKALTNAYRHIKDNNPEMEVIVWGDMLDEQWNGAQKSKRISSGKNTAAAINLIPKDIIIADWRYEANRHYEYDPAESRFPSIGKFLDKGFRVWPTSWVDVKATTDLVWTGNIEQTRTGRVVGHLYSTWLDGIVPELALLLYNPERQVSEEIVARFSDAKKPIFMSYYRGLADSINATSHLVGIQRCRGTDSSCGAYPDCEDTIAISEYQGKKFHAYYCDNNTRRYKVIPFPEDYVAFWQFETNAKDTKAKNDGIINDKSFFVKDTKRGMVAKLSGAAGAIQVPDSPSLQMGRGSLSISAWFKTPASKELGVILSKGLTNYALLLHPDGRILFETNGNNFYRYSTDGVSFSDNKWHHVVAIFDSIDLNIDIYVDGHLVNGRASTANGSNEKSGNSPLYLGSYNGYLDDVMLFNRVISFSEVMALYKFNNSVK